MRCSRPSHKVTSTARRLETDLAPNLPRSRSSRDGRPIPAGVGIGCDRSESSQSDHDTDCGLMYIYYKAYSYLGTFNFLDQLDCRAAAFAFNSRYHIAVGLSTVSHIQ